MDSHKSAEDSRVLGPMLRAYRLVGTADDMVPLVWEAMQRRVRIDIVMARLLSGRPRWAASCGGQDAGDHA